jgi:hypothetical protein
MAKPAVKKPTKEEIFNQKAEYLNRLRAIDKAFDDRYIQAVDTFGKQQLIPPRPSYEPQRSVDKLAGQLSKSYPSLRVTLIFENGVPSIAVVPIRYKKFVLPNEGPEDDLDNRLLERVRYAEGDLKRIDEFWPALESVQAYVKGYYDGAAAVSTLESKIKELEERLVWGGMPGLPFRRM